jgi:hypothetical protein
MNKKISNKGQARIFQNPYLEMLTKSHPLVIWGMYIPLLSYLVYRGIQSTGYSAPSRYSWPVLFSGVSLNTWRTGIFFIG